MKYEGSRLGTQKVVGARRVKKVQPGGVELATNHAAVANLTVDCVFALYSIELHHR